MFKILNVFFRYFLIFLAVFVWTRFFVKNFYLAVFYATTLSIIIDIIINKILSTKVEKRNLKKTEETKMEDCFYELITASNETMINYFENVFKKNYKIKTEKKFIQILHEDYVNVFYPFMSYEKLTKQKIVELLKLTKNLKKKRLIISCYALDLECEKFAQNEKNCEIVIFDKVDTFRHIMKKFNEFPEINAKKCEKKRKNYKNMLNIMFSKGKTKHYLSASFFVLLSSFFVRYNIYYVILSSILLILAFISLLFPMYKKKDSDEIL